MKPNAAWRISPELGKDHIFISNEALETVFHKRILLKEKYVILNLIWF